MKKEVNDLGKTIKKLVEVEGIDFLTDEEIVQLAMDLLTLKAIRGIDESIQNMTNP